jgi:hypothetical protein
MDSQIIARTHEEDEMTAARRKQAYFYLDALHEEIDIISQAIQRNTAEMAEYAKRMTPPYPFVAYEDIPEGKVFSRISILVGIAMEQTVKNLKTISEQEWQEIFLKYKDVSAGKGATEDQRKELHEVRMSDRMLELSEIICTYIEANGLTGAIIHKKYLRRMDNVPSHKITTFVAVMHCAKFLMALKAEQTK